MKKSHQIFLLLIPFLTIISQCQTDQKPDQPATQELSGSEGPSATNVPVVIWASSPVKPGETVLLHGGNFGENPVIELTSGRKKLTITPISVSEASVMFIFPETWKPGIVDGVVRSGDLLSKSFSLNAPDVWWIHGDRGREASTLNGNLKLIGNCLNDPDMPAPKILLQKVTGEKKGKAISLNVVKYNRYFIQTANWEEVPEGSYEVVLKQNGNNHPVTTGMIRISEKKNEIPAEVFNVVDFGAIPNDGIDDSQSVLQAVEQLKKNGGGVLLFPVGRFQMNQTIELPPYTILKGMGADFSQIYWPDTYEPLNALIRGTHSFEVSNIFLTCGNHRDGIVGNIPHPHEALDSEYGNTGNKCGNISITNVTMRMLFTQFIIHDMDELKRRLQPLRPSRALRFGGENINITGNNIHCVAGGVFELRAYWSNISNNIFSRGGIAGWSGFGGQQLIFTDNHLRGSNTLSFYSWPEGSENIYWGNNYQEMTFDGNNRESLTGDLRTIVYHNHAENITPVSFTTIIGETTSWTLPSSFNSEGDNLAPAGKSEIWENGVVQIAGGRGVGQIRRIKSVEGNKIELQSAWDIIPDETSVMDISSFRRRFIYTENRTDDSSLALQFYGSMIEGIIANNVTSRTGGYQGDTNRDMPHWFNQFLDNTIETGLTYRGPRNQVPAMDAHLGLLGRGLKYPVIRSCVIRNNTLKCNAKLDITGNVVDCLFENNSIANANVGMTIDEDARNIVLSKNSFQGVNKPYAYNPHSVVIRPMEELWSAMDGVITLMDWQSLNKMPEEWLKVYKKNDLLNSTADQVKIFREEAVKAFANQNPDKIFPDKLIEALTGIQMHTPDWKPMYSILREGNAGSSSLIISTPNCKVNAHLKLSLHPDDFSFEGWSFTFPESDLIPGKNTQLKAAISKPEGKMRLLRIPLLGELSGDGWKLNFTTEITDRWEKFYLDNFMISQPIDNPLNSQNDKLGYIQYTGDSRNVQDRLGYLRYEDIPKPAKNKLSKSSIKSGKIDLAALFNGKNNIGRIIYGITSVKSNSPVTVRFEFSRNCLFYVNGKIIGTTLGRGQWGFVRLEEGENKVEMLMISNEDNKWQFDLPAITWIEKTGAVEL